MKHLVVFNEEQVKGLLNGQLNYFWRFFKKSPEFLKQLSVGDTVFIRKKRGEVVGQFEVGKLMIIEKPDISDWKIVEGFGVGNKEQFNETLGLNNILLIVQITKLEQFITSPIEIDKRSKKEWIVLD